MLTSSAKAKGRKLQQWTRDLLIRLSGLPSSDITSTSMGASGDDVKLANAARQLFGNLAIECKARARVAAHRWLDQVEDRMEDSAVPIVVVKENHRPPVAYVDAEWLFNLIYNYNKKETEWKSTSNLKLPEERQSLMERSLRKK